MTPTDVHSSRYQYEPMQEEHLVEVSRLHIETFPDYFLTSLGPYFLRAWYRWYSLPKNLAIVALDAERNVVGMIVGVTDSNRYQLDLVRETGPRLAWGLLRQCLTRPSLIIILCQSTRWRGFAASILKAILKLTFALPFLRRRVASTNAHQVARIVSFAVAPTARFIGLLLFNMFIIEATWRGCQLGSAVVSPANNQAVFFYEAMGWKATGEYVDGSGKRGIVFTKRLDEKKDADLSQ